MQTDFCTMTPNKVRKISKILWGGSNHIFNSRERFVEYTHHKVYPFLDKAVINAGIIYFVNWVKNRFNINIQLLQTDDKRANSVPASLRRKFFKLGLADRFNRSSSEDVY